MLVSRPEAVDDAVACAVQFGNTVCARPGLTNITLSPTTDATGAPIIMAEGDTLLELEEGSSIFWGTYKTPSGEPGDTGTLPDNIDLLFHFARVRIDSPRAVYFNVNEENGFTVSGIYTNNSSSDENVTAIRIRFTLSDGSTIGYDVTTMEGGHFSCYTTVEEIGSDWIKVRAIATSADNKGGFDLIRTAPSDDHDNPEVAITDPESNAFKDRLNVTVSVAASDYTTDVQWVTINGNLAEYYYGQDLYTYIFDELPEGPMTFTATASDYLGNLGFSDTVTVNITTDEDHDGLPDDWESQYGLLPSEGGADDNYDSDGLTNIAEYWAGTDPKDNDTDDDGLLDGAEAGNGMDPLDADSDDDGLPDGKEVALPCFSVSSQTPEDRDQDGLCDGDTTVLDGPTVICIRGEDLNLNGEVDEGESDPCDQDTDDDRLKDGEEIENNCDPANPDSDDDGLNDKAEVVYGTSCDNYDTDHDTMHDGWELYFGFDPLSPADGGTADYDSDGLINIDEYYYGSNPTVADSDQDGINDGDEVPGRNPALHEEPVIFAIFPGVATVGDNITILGYRLRDGTTVDTDVTINGYSAAAGNCATGDTVSICATVPTGAGTFSSPPITVSATFGSTTWTSIGPPRAQYFPYKVVPSGGNIIAELEPGPTDIQDGQTAFGLIRYGDKDYYRIHLNGASVLNISASAFDVMADVVVQNADTSEAHVPNTYLEVTDANANFIASSDDAGSSTTNSELNEVVLDGGTYFINVTVPQTQTGNTSQGYYALRVDRLEAPYITDISPAFGETSSVITIAGANFATDQYDGNSVQFLDGATVYEGRILTQTPSAIVLNPPSELPGLTVFAYDLKIINHDLSPDRNSSEYAHNDPAVFHLLTLSSSIVPEHAFGSANLEAGQTAMGFPGYERAKFTFSGITGNVIQAKISIHALSTGDPIPSDTVNLHVDLIAPDQSQVPHFGAATMTQSGNTLIQNYALPDDGTYLLSVRRNPLDSDTVYYQMKYTRQTPDPADSIEIVDGNTQILPVVKGGNTVFNPMSVLVKNNGTPVQNYPVIFKTKDRHYLAFTDSSGVATASDIQTPEPPIQGRVVAFPAGHLWLKAKFDFVLTEAYARDDWDGDGVPNGQDAYPMSVEINDFPKTIVSDVDDDGDGLDNKVEEIIGTDEGEFDTDGDGYPDGFEVSHNLDPLNSDSVSVKMVPLGFYPDLHEEIFIYALARDNMGHLRKDIELDYSDYGNLTILSPCFSEGTDSQGLDSCKVETPALGNYQITASSGSASDTLYFQAVLGQEDDPISKMSEDNEYSFTNPFELYEQPLVVRLHSGAASIKNARVTFSVLQPVETPPSGFINAKLYQRPLVYPRTPPLITLDPDAGDDSVTVYTDNNGEARARVYLGSTGGLHYRVLATADAIPPQNGNTVSFTIHANEMACSDSCTVEVNYSDDHNGHSYGSYHWEPVGNILANKQVELNAWHMLYTHSPSTGGPDTWTVAPAPSDEMCWSVAAYYNWPGGCNIGSGYTDAHGHFSALWTAPAENPTPYPFMWNYYFIYASGATHCFAQYIRQTSDIHVYMYRKTNTGQSYSVANNGTIYPSDQELFIQVQNPTSYFMELLMNEYPDKGGDMLKAEGNQHWGNPNKIVVFPGTNNYYYFKIAPKAATGGIDFSIHDHETGEVLKTMHVSMQCVNGCTDCAVDKELNMMGALYDVWLMKIGEPQGNSLWNQCKFDWNLLPLTQTVPMKYYLGFAFSCDDWAVRASEYLNKVKHCCEAYAVGHGIYGYSIHSTMRIKCQDCEGNYKDRKWYDPFTRMIFTY